MILVRELSISFSPKQKRIKAITCAIGPFGDANEVGLVAVGGVLFLPSQRVMLQLSGFLFGFDHDLPFVHF